MNREENTAGEKIGWHVIARGGDMTARVHGGMCLGQGPSGEISFEPVDGVVRLSLEGSQLRLTALQDDQELLVPGEHPARAVLVSPQTHVSLTFCNYTLDIDNDFMRARPSGSSLHIEVVDAEGAATRQARGPASSGRRLRSVSSSASNRTIVVSEVGSSLWTTPADRLPRTERQRLSPAAKRPLVIGGTLLGAVGALLALAIYLPGRLSDHESTSALPTPGDIPPSTAQPDQVPEPTPDAVLDTATGTEDGVAVASSPVTDGTVDPAAAAAGPAMVPAESGAARVSDALLERFTALISAERLPDRGTVDFVIESLRSLQAAYPGDTRVPEALNLLALRLLDEARAAYGTGDAFRAGRLIELAVTTGAARSAVDEALAGMTTRSPAATPTETTPPPAPAVQTRIPVEPEREAAAVAATAAAVGAAAGVETRVRDVGGRDEDPASTSAQSAMEPEVSDDGGLDALVYQATGVPVGALAVDPSSETGSDQVLTLMLEDAPPDEAATADRLPAGFVLEDAGLAVPQPPAYRPFNELTPTRRTPLTYPENAPRRRDGSVDVSFTVSETGEVVDVTAESDMETIFVEAARQTIARWRFTPVLTDGRPTAVRSAIRVTFRD